MVSAGKYPPEGTRGIGHICAHMIFGVSESDYEQQANDNLMTMVQIESREGLQNVEEIAAVPGIAVLFVGGCSVSFLASEWLISRPIRSGQVSRSANGREGARRGYCSHLGGGA